MIYYGLNNNTFKLFLKEHRGMYVCIYLRSLKYEYFYKWEIWMFSSIELGYMKYGEQLFRPQLLKMNVTNYIGK